MMPRPGMMGPGPRQPMQQGPPPPMPQGPPPPPMSPPGGMPPAPAPQGSQMQSAGMGPGMDGMEDDAHCGNCRYFRATDMRCQRYPPEGSAWAMVDKNSWCGEHMHGMQKEAFDPDAMDEGAELANQQIS